MRFLQLGPGVISEVREGGEVVEEGAVLDDGVVAAGVLESPMVDLHRERHRQRCARGERLGQTIDEVAVGRIVRRQRCARDADRRLHLRRHDHMQVANRLRGLVDQRVGAADVDPPFVGLDVDVSLDVGDARLRNAVVLLVELLRFGRALVPLVLGRVVIEDVRVVEDVAAGGAEREDEQSQRGENRLVETCAGHARPDFHRRLRSADPEEMSGDQQDGGEDRPVEA